MSKRIMTRARFKRVDKIRKFRSKVKSNIKSFIKNLPKNIVKNTVYLIVGLLDVIYLIVKHFDNVIAKLFMRLPRLIKVSLVYILVIGFVLNFVDIKGTYAISSDDTKDDNVEVEDTETSENVSEEVQTDDVVLTDEEIKEVADTNFSCSMSTIACQIYYSALNVGMTKDQAIMTLAIGMAECGRNFDSDNVIYKNNFGGLYDCTNNRFYSYNTQEEGINAFVNTIKKYIDRGQDTPAKIQVNYAPIDAENDPQGKNKNWLPNVLTIINDISTQIK